MIRRISLPWLCLVATLFVTGCSGSPETPLSPSLAAPGTADANPDGSTLKVNAPTGLSPAGSAVIGSNQVNLTFQPAAARHVSPVGMQHRIELYDRNQTRIAEWTTAATSVTTPELQYQENYSWRVQPVLDGHVGPWSALARFVTPAPPTPPECLAQPIEANRMPCILAVAAKSDEWSRCQAGSGSACHRFTREVARALSLGDPMWGLLGKPPGVWQCSLTACGSNVSGGFGEDVIVYCTNFPACTNPNAPDGRTDWVGIDIIIAAGLPGAQISWGPLPRVFNRGNNWWVPVP